MKKAEDHDPVKGSLDTTQEEATGRRKLLKSLLAGSAVVTGSMVLPETWTRPLTTAVVLPAHAGTSTDPDPGYDSYS